jgi:ubiquitin carboxyl-terminal hydrolase 25
VVDIRISPPRLSKYYLSLICDPAKLSRRHQKAVKKEPERFPNGRPLTPEHVMIMLRVYLHDALNQSTDRERRLWLRNNKYLLAFADECNGLFKYLDFESIDLSVRQFIIRLFRITLLRG